MVLNILNPGGRGIEMKEPLTSQEVGVVYMKLPNGTIDKI